MFLYICFIMACKYHHLNSWGQTEGKKKQAAGVTGGWVRYVSRYLDGDVPRIFQSNFINYFGPRSSPVIELLSPGRRSLSQIQFGLSQPPPNWTIKSKWGGSLKLGTTSISLVKQQDMLVTGCGLPGSGLPFYIVYSCSPVIVHAWQVVWKCEDSVFLMICGFSCQCIV